MKLYSKLLTLMFAGVVALSLATPVEVFAQYSAGLVPEACSTDVTKCDFCSFIEMTSNVINLLFQILVIVAVIMVVVTGFRLVTSGGNVSAMEKSKESLTNVIIGFVIVLSAWMIVDTVIKTLVADGQPFGVWNKFDGDCGGVINAPGT